MEESCSMADNGTRKSPVTITKLDTSRSIRRFLLGGVESPSPVLYGTVGSTSPLPGERVLIRSKTCAVFDSSTLFGKCYAGTLLLSLVSVVVLSVLVLSDKNVLSLDCPFVGTSGDSNRRKGSFELAPGKSIDSLQEEETTTGFGRNSNENLDRNELVDDEKCWSRSRHLLYRPEDRHHPPSPALRRSLSRYEALHARCTVGKTWDSVGDLQQNSDPGKNTEGGDDCKYLIYMEGWEGLGNRILSLVSAFAFSLATNRVLLIDSRGHLQDLLCEPFNSSSWKLPKDFPYDRVDNFPSLEKVGPNYESELGINLNLRHEQSERDRTFFCPETQRRLSGVQWLAWSSNQYYIPRLLMIPSFWTEFSPLFPNPPHAFSQLVRFLCLPVNPVWAKTERTYQAYLSSSPNSKLVGLQIRTHTQPTFSRAVFDKAMNCLLGARILPNVSLHDSAPPALTPGGNSRGTTSVFVASLHREYFETLRDLYLDQGTEDGSRVNVQTVAYQEAETFSLDSSVKAYIDIWLLSFSDTLVTSGWSTFGYLAQALAGVRPVVMSLMAPSPPFCSLGQSMEPCNHFPFLSTCGNTTGLINEHGRWLQKHLRHCQDEDQGRQIV